MTTFQAGQRVKYYHAMLDRTLDATVKRVTARQVVVSLELPAPLGGSATRALTHSQADSILNVGGNR